MVSAGNMRSYSSVGVPPAGTHPCLAVPWTASLTASRDACPRCLPSTHSGDDLPRRGQKTWGQRLPAGASRRQQLVSQPSALPSPADTVERWCQDHFLSCRALRMADVIRAELLEIVKRIELPCAEPAFGSKENTLNIKKALLSGYFMQVRGHRAAVWGHYRSEGTRLFCGVTTGQRAQGGCVGSLQVRGDKVALCGRCRSEGTGLPCVVAIRLHSQDMLSGISRDDYFLATNFKTKR